MTTVLPVVTTLFDLVALAVSLSLGFYIVTRSPRSRTSWLAALTLWCLSLFFFHNALAINMPGSSLLPMLQATMLLVPALWYHLSIELRRERTGEQGRAWDPGRRTRTAALQVSIGRPTAAWAEVLRNMVRSYVDLFRVMNGTLEQLYAASPLDPATVEAVEACCANGQGLILVDAHMRSFDMMLLALRQHFPSIQAGPSPSPWAAR